MIHLQSGNRRLLEMILIFEMGFYSLVLIFFKLERVEALFFSVGYYQAFNTEIVEFNKWSSSILTYRGLLCCIRSHILLTVLSVSTYKYHLSDAVTLH